ncbi:hypothetical protein AOQ84DRAFT_294130 [Glonium stellatum]|uniref:Uncharacterized protein n=1 Tax=Glonium stellatum TaxID=574774 RepID=A0A8E2JSW2_9PEZI|nr:hypothetical protein AOQ84DRAFT_294130 [Glonium stellatum]
MLQQGWGLLRRDSCAIGPPANATPGSYGAIRPRKRQRLSTDQPISSQIQNDELHKQRAPIYLPSPESCTGSGEEIINPLLDWTKHTIPDLPDFTRFFQGYDWSRTALGPMQTWGTELCSHVFMIMNHPAPRVILWGSEFTLIYNGPCAALIRDKHPETLGSPGAVGFAAAWEQLHRNLKITTETGKVTTVEDHYIPLSRDGLDPEETYWSYTLLPILAKDGSAVGALKELTETTQRVVGQRRLETSRRVEKMDAAQDLTKFWSQVVDILESNQEDFPFALLYSVVNDAGPKTPEAPTTTGFVDLEGVIGIKADHPLAVPRMEIPEKPEGLQAHFKRSWVTGDPVMLQTSDGSLPQSLAIRISGRGLNSICNAALLYPIVRLDGPGAVGFLLLGMNPQRPYDDDYRNFIKLLVDHIVKAAASKEQKELKRRTKNAERQERTFTNLAKMAPVGIAIFPPNGPPTWKNHAYDYLSGIVSDNEQPYGWRVALHPEDRSRVDSSFRRLLEGPLSLTLEFRVRNTSPGSSEDGEANEWRWLLSNASSEVDEHGNVSKITSFLADITHHKRAQQLQAQRLEDALETKRQSENFIDMTCHEMRNPLSAIIQSADGILSAFDADQMGSIAFPNQSLAPDHIRAAVVDAAQTIVLCSQHQKRIVDDILTLSKLDSNLLLISPDPIQPVALVKNALQMYDAYIREAKVTASFSIDQSYHDLAIDYVLLDPARLLQVLINLLTNAIKFTRDSSTRHITIQLGASLTQPSSGPGKVSYIHRREQRTEQLSSGEWGTGQEVFLQFDVSDTGRGLTTEEMKLLFLRFSQASPKTYAQYGGSGLGLFISRELTELQGGQIGVHSVASQGSTFTFYVKGRQYMPESPNTLGSTKTRISRDGLGDPTRDCLDILPINFALPGFHANNGLAKLDPDLKALLRTLHVLLVEDNLINQKVMAQQLRQLGCTVYVANNGLEALNFVAKTTYSAKPVLDNAPSSPVSSLADTGLGPCSSSTSTTETQQDSGLKPLSIILMDLEMPFMNGLTCVHRIREMQQDGTLLGHIPIIAITANARGEQIATALSQGMDQVVTKPFRIPELLPKILQLVGGAEPSIQD